MLTKKGKQHKQGQGAVRPGVALRQTKGTDDRPGANCIAEADPRLMNKLLSREKVANALGDGQATEDFNAHSRAHRVKTFCNVKTKPVGEVRPGVASLFPASSSLFASMFASMSPLTCIDFLRKGATMFSISLWPWQPMRGTNTKNHLQSFYGLPS